LPSLVSYSPTYSTSSWRSSNTVISVFSSALQAGNRICACIQTTTRRREKRPENWRHEARSCLQGRVRDGLPPQASKYHSFRYLLWILVCTFETLQHAKRVQGIIMRRSFALPRVKSVISSKVRIEITHTILSKRNNHPDLSLGDLGYGEILPCRRTSGGWEPRGGGL